MSLTVLEEGPWYVYCALFLIVFDFFMTLLFFVFFPRRTFMMEIPEFAKK